MHRLLYGGTLCIHYTQQLSLIPNFLTDLYSGKYLSVECDHCKKRWVWKNNQWRSVFYNKYKNRSKRRVRL